MPHSLCRIWIHLVYGTKYATPLITPALKPVLYLQKLRELEKLRCEGTFMNGTADHVHVLTRMPATCAAVQVLQQIKGAVSRWVNAAGLSDQYFDWQTGYAAFSVSENAVARVRRYIERQEEHHRRKTWQEEMDGYARLGVWTPGGEYGEGNSEPSIVRDDEAPY